MSSFTSEFKKFRTNASDKFMTELFKLIALLIVMAILGGIGAFNKAIVLIVIATIGIAACVSGLIVIIYDEVLRVRSIPQKKLKDVGKRPDAVPDISK